MNQQKTCIMKLNLIFTVVVLVIFTSCKKESDEQEKIPENIWTGPFVEFSKDAEDDWTLASNQDKITDNVTFTRANKKAIFNIANESSYSDDFGGPSDTEWAIGNIDDWESLEYSKWIEAVDGSPTDFLNQNMVVHLVTDDIYFSIIFTLWGGGATNNSGALTYKRSTPLNIEDSDNDGVADSVDICPDTPGGTTADIFGCN